MSMRKEKAKKQSKFKYYILTPFRILSKGKELYVKGVVNCSGALGVGVRSSVHTISHHPHTLTQTESRRDNKSRPNVQRELLRTVPIAMVGNETRAVNVMHKRINVGYKYNRTKMSYHTEVRKMGTIDEDKPCYFEEDQNGSNSKPNLLYLYPRSRVCDRR